MAMKVLGAPADASTVRIVPLRRRHLRRVMRIERQVYPKPWTPGVFQGELAILDGTVGPEHPWVGRTLVGMAELAFRDGLTTRSEQLTVRSLDVRRKALPATHPLALWARANGCTALTLEVRVSNAAAQAMYRRFGFAPAGIRQRYYENTEDAIVMWAHDVDGPEYGDRLDGLLAGVPGTTQWADGVRGDC